MGTFRVGSEPQGATPPPAYAGPQPLPQAQATAPATNTTTTTPAARSAPRSARQPVRHAAPAPQAVAPQANPTADADWETF
ncbi:MAG TPA: hypothetical protein PK306_24020 [Aquabacterium sp.]|nr:hypothetical protein [Aquabacterium sp.]HQC98773.1 hypothetical protein [Aquabacterium sp.]